MKFSGSLFQDGQLVLRLVEGEFTRITPLPGGKEAWHGRMDFLPAERPPVTGHYTLTLDDGRSNMIQFMGATYSTTGNTYQFTGVP